MQDDSGAGDVVEAGVDGWRRHGGRIEHCAEKWEPAGRGIHLSGNGFLDSRGAGAYLRRVR